MGEKIKVSNELNGPEINAMIKAILEDSEIIEAMKKNRSSSIRGIQRCI